jgi:hypothetical protein
VIQAVEGAQKVAWGSQDQALLARAVGETEVVAGCWEDSELQMKVEESQKWVVSEEEG